MIILTNTTDKVQVKLSATVAANQLPCFASYRDTTTSTISASRNVLNSNNITAVDLVGSPASSTQRIVDYISVYNADTAAATVTIQFNDNGTLYSLYVVSLSAGEKLEYQEGTGFQILSTTGSVRIANNSSLNTSTAVSTFVLKATDQSSTVTAFANITGLSFSVTSGKTYWFRFVIPYSTSIISNGARFAVSGPASPTVLYYYTDVNASTAARSPSRGLTTYDASIASGNTAALTGNIAIVEGIIKPSSSGTLIGRIASEVAASTITQKGGSFIQYLEI